MAAPRLLEGHLFFSIASCDLTAFCGSLLADCSGTGTSRVRLNVRICRKHCVFFRVHGGYVAEKSWLAFATVAGVAALPWNLSRTARAMY